MVACELLRQPKIFAVSLRVFRGGGIRDRGLSLLFSKTRRSFCSKTCG